MEVFEAANTAVASSTSSTRVVSPSSDEQQDWQTEAAPTPSYDPRSPYVRFVVCASLSGFFIAHLPTEDPRLKAVFWNFEGGLLHVCTVIASDDFEFEKLIYAAELTFIERFPKVQTDFYVLPQDGRSLDEVRPDGCVQVYPTT